MVCDLGRAAAGSRGDFVAESFELGDESAWRAGAVAPTVEVVADEVGVGLAGRAIISSLADHTHRVV